MHRSTAPCSLLASSVLALLLQLPNFGWARDPTYLTAEVGESVVLNCEVEFPHDVVVPYILRWNKEHEPVFAWEGSDQRETAESFKGRVSRLESSATVAGISNLGRGAVNLTSIRESDEGWYECKVFFPNRNPPTRPNGTWFHLNVEGGKLLAIPPINQTAMEGESAIFRCVAKHAGARVTWSRDGVPLPQIPSLWARSQVDADGSLSITSTEHTDPGLFRCEVTNDAGERQSAGAYLNVLYKAKVVLAPAEQFLAFGRHGLLDCHFRANPPLTYLRWEKDGFLYDAYNVPGVLLQHNGSLAFEQVDESHAGVYTCMPFNDLGTAGASSPMTVLVQRPPVFTLRPAPLYVRRIGDSVDIACTSTEEGNPEDPRPPVIAWTKKDGSPLPAGRHVFSGGNLTIQGLRLEDSGVYMCTANNEAARIVAETELLVEQGASRAPHSLSANSSHDAISLRWTPGARRPAQFNYVWYRQADLAEWRSVRVSAGIREAVLVHLKPGTMYEVMVASRDIDGEGTLSRPLNIHTKGVAVQEETTQLELTPGSVPRNVSVQSLGNSWLVTWVAPEKAPARGGRAGAYTVRWRQRPSESDNLESDWEPRGGSVDTDENWLLVRGLEEGATYVFDVEVRGVSGSSARVEIDVPENPKPRGARAVVLAALVAAIVLVAVAVASWHGGRTCTNRSNNRARGEQRTPADAADRKAYDALMTSSKPHSLGENIWVAPNTLSATTQQQSPSSAAGSYPRGNFD